MERGPDNKKIIEKEPPYGWILKKYHEAGLEIEYTNTCSQCLGTGYDSPEKNAACCTCYGVGDVFYKNGRPVDYKIQREFVQKIRDMEIKKERNNGNE